MSDNQKINYHDLQYYFDSQVKNALDGRSLCDRSRTMNALVGRLLQLPKSEFESAVKALTGLLDQGHAKNQDDDTEQNRNRHLALELYEAKSGGPNAIAKIESV